MLASNSPGSMIDVLTRTKQLCAAPAPVRIPVDSAPSLSSKRPPQPPSPPNPRNPQPRPPTRQRSSQNQIIMSPAPPSLKILMPTHPHLPPHLAQLLHQHIPRPNPRSN